MDPTPVKRPEFQLDVTNEAPFEQALRLYRSLAKTKQFFRKSDKSIWACLLGLPPYRLSTIEAFKSALEAQFNLIKSVNNSVTPVPVSLRRDQASALFHNLAFLELPLLKTVIGDPCIICDPEPRLTAPGFDENHGIYYWLPPAAHPIEPSDSLEHLATCFSGVPFEHVYYRNNLLAWLLGAVVLEPYLEPPFLVISGNTQLIGKTKTLLALGKILLDDDEIQPIRIRGEEFSKQLSARFCSGHRFIPFDNVDERTGGVHNDLLASLLTSGRVKRARILKESKEVEQDSVLFAMTANRCRLDDDLTSRALVVKLYRDTPGIMKPYVIDYAKEYRREIYAELLGLALKVTDYDVNGHHLSFRYRTWLNFCLPRINKTFGPLAIQSSREVSDVNGEVYTALLNAGNWDFTSGDFLARIKINPADYPALMAQLANRSERSKTRQLYKILNALIDQDYVDPPDRAILRCLNFEESTDSKVARRFKLEILNGNPAPTLPAPSPNPL